MVLNLKQVTRDNWRQVIALEITDDQWRFLDSESLLYALAEIQFYPSYIPFAIYDEDTLIGCASYGYLPENPSKWWIPLLIIDHRHQGKGYGRAAMQAIIQRIQQEAPECRAIGLSYKPANSVADRLYRSLGFERTDEIDELGNTHAWLKVDPPKV